MFRLAHLSDPHLGPLPQVSYRQLASKRVTGYVNWHRNRSQHMTDDVIDLVTADIAAAKVDHLAITGDLVNLALDGEIEAARLWLETLGEPENVSVVPGNHDAYVPGAFDKACRSWGRWMTGDGGSPRVDRSSFPYLRVRGNVALIGISTARATAPFMATGYFRAGQADRLASLLDETGRKGLFRVIMIHHPPVRDAAPAHKRLLGIDRFQKLVRGHGAELVLHGHTHVPTVYRIAGKDGMVPVIGVAAAGEASGVHRPLSHYNLFEVTGKAGAWHVVHSRRGLSPTRDEIVTLSHDTLVGNPGRGETLEPERPFVSM